MIYAILFVGISQATLGKRFEGRGGKAVVAAVGLVLALGLSVSGKALGFSLRSFGPLAAGFFIFMVGFCLFLGIKTMGVGGVSAGSIALVVTYFSIRAVTPSIFDWMTGNPYTSWLHAVLVIAVIISAYRVFRLILPGQEVNLGREARKLLGGAVRAPREMLERVHAGKQEKDFIEARLERITEEAEKNSRQILEDLEEIKKLINEFGATARGRFLIAKKIQGLAPGERRAMQSIDSLRQMVRKLSVFDSQHFEKLRQEYHSMPAEGRRRVEDELRAEWKKINAEKELARLEDELAGCDRKFSHAMRVVGAALRAGRRGDAQAWIDEAIKWEKGVQKCLLEMEELEKRLERYTAREIKEQKQELKAVAKAKSG